jgi:hypothetical protein
VSGWKFDADRVVFRVEVASAEEALANGFAVGGQVNEVLGHHCNYFWVKGEGLKFIGRVLGGRVESRVEETGLFFFDCFVTFSTG